MIDLQNYTDEDLLRELVRRNGIVDGPISRTMHLHEVLLGIGKDHHCYITFTDRDDVEALMGNKPADNIHVFTGGKRPEDMAKELGERLKSLIYEYSGRMTVEAAVGVLHIVTLEVIMKNDGHD